MIKVMQYGEGNFLRAFADLYFNTLNEEGLGDFSVTIIKPTNIGNLKKFESNNCNYNVVLRGYEDGQTVENAYKVTCVNRAIDPFIDFSDYIALAKDEDLKLIVSNTTEAGICFNDSDEFGAFQNVTFPAKLTQFLYERFKLGLGGVYLLPVELIDNNADALKLCVDKYISLWNLPEEFKKWNDEQNFYCNTLVDRIVSGYPKDNSTLEHLTALVGEKDELLTVGEPFGLWAIENKGDLKSIIKEGRHNIDVVLTNDIDYYKKRKVRVLNGSHTNLVPAGLIFGASTVFDCMQDINLSKFLKKTLETEIIPFVSSNVEATTDFANSVIQRFLNPFLNHQLTSIALNSISKWKARDLPSFKDYYQKHGEIPKRLTIGFSYLIALYKKVKKVDGDYFVILSNRVAELKDDAKYLDYFANNQPIDRFLKDETIWGENLDNYEGFIATVISNVEKIEKGFYIL